MKNLKITQTIVLQDTELLEIIEKHTEFSISALLYCYAEIKRRELVLSENLLKALKEISTSYKIDNWDEEVTKVAKSHGDNSYSELYENLMEVSNKQKEQTTNAVPLQETLQPHLKASNSGNSNQSANTTVNSSLKKTNKVVNVSLSGGIIGLLAGSPQDSLNDRIQLENSKGWSVIQVIPADSGNLFLTIFRLILLVCTCLLYTTANGYYVVMERNEV